MADEDETTPLEVAPNVDVGSNGSTAGELHCDVPGCDYSAFGRWAARTMGFHKRFTHGIAGTKPHGRPADRPAGRGHQGQKSEDEKTKPPKPHSKRRSLAPVLGPAYGMLGQNFVPGKPGGFMAWSAPAAGPILDNCVAGTWVDRQAQRFAGDAEKYRKLGSLLALPLIAGAIERQPALKDNPLLRQLGREAIVDVLEAELDYEIKGKAKVERLDAKAVRAGYEGLEEKVTMMMAVLFGDGIYAPQEAGPAPAPV